MEHLLKRLREQDIVISLENNDLKVKFNGVGLPTDLIKELKENKAEIVKYLSDANAHPANTDIRKLDHQENYPLSSSQLRVFMLSQFEDANLAYNMPGAYVFEGDLKMETLEDSFNALITRHEILRTAFKEDELGEIRQFVCSTEEMGFKLAYFDLRKAAGQETMLKKAVQAELIKPFNLASLPLLRAGIYQVAVNRWVCTYVMHHIISDGWSMDILINELLVFYNAFAKRETVSLRPLRIQYKDYAFWQNQQLKEAALQSHRSYWLKQFGGDLPVLALPGDHARPIVKSYHGGTIGKRIDAGTSKGIKAFCRQQDATLFMGLLAIITALLYRYTGQEDIIIGTPIAGRDHLDLEDQIGLYLNTLALRSRFKGEDSFRDLLANTRKITLEAYEHQAYPFEELVNDLRLHRDMSRSPLFDVMLILQNANVRSAKLQQTFGDFNVSEYPFRENKASKFDLTFDFVEMGDELQATIEYNSDIYNERTAEELLSHLQRLLEAALAHPFMPVRELDYLSREEKQQLLFQFNDTGRILPDAKTFIALFEEQAARTPANVASIHEGQPLTYEELNEQSNRLGRYLRDVYEIGPDDLVVLCLDRSAYMLIGVLAILKSGGAYVPLDPGYPADRIGYVLRDTNAKVLLTNLHLEEKLKPIADGLRVSIECIDSNTFREKLSSAYEPSNPVIAGGPSNLVYVIYTSGTTGAPKGVMVEQYSYINLLSYYKNTFFKEDDPVNTLSVTNYVFDIWGLEYGLPLISGGFIELSGGEFESLDTGNYTFIQMTPGLLLARYDAIKFNNPRLKLFVGGEAVSDKLLARILSNHTIAYLLNVYGPTETTIWSLNQVNTKDHFNTNIGRPISNTTVYVLDNNRAPVPVGAIGELYIGGTGVARGYLNNDLLTAEKFIADPFRPGQRIYRTGDLGRWLPDGTIAFMGRRDDQVKIRGYRIELGEIETALQGYDGVDAAVVVVRIDASEEKELVAYLTGKEDLHASDLRSYLTEYLPAYMMPARYIQLPKLPLTPNGKVDKKKLPDPEGLDMLSGVAYLSPRNSIEEQLVSIWQKLLGKDKIGIRDNFFDLGGNSMKLLKMVMVSNKTFDKKLSVAMAFRYANISALSEYLNAGHNISAGESEKEMDMAVAVMDKTFSLLNNNGDED